MLACSAFIFKVMVSTDNYMYFAISSENHEIK